MPRETLPGVINSHFQALLSLTPLSLNKGGPKTLLPQPLSDRNLDQITRNPRQGAE